MRLARLKITNFASLRGEHLINFDAFLEKKILITGDNEISEGVDSNGSGKSSIFDAISWCLFNKTPKKLDVDEVVNDFEKYCEVQLQLIGAKNIVILRKRTKGDESELEFWVDEQHKKGRILSQTQDMLLAELGISAENKDYFGDFLNATYISTESIETFASKSSTNKERISLVSRFLNLEVLEKAKKIADDKADLSSKSLEACNTAINSFIESIKRLEPPEACSNLIEISKRHIKESEGAIVHLNEEMTKATEMMDLEMELVSLQSRIKILETEKSGHIYTNQSRIETLEQALKDIEKTETSISLLQADTNALENKFPPSVTLEGAEENLKVTETELKTISLRKRDVENYIRQIWVQMQGGLECPVCKSKLHLEASTLVQYDRTKLEKEKEEETKEQTKLTAVENTLQEKLGKLKRHIQDIRDSHSRLEYLKRDLHGKQGIIERKQDFQKQLEDTRSNLEQSYLTYESKIASLNQQHALLANKLIEGKTRSVKDINSEISLMNSIINEKQSIVAYHEGIISKHDEYRKNIKSWEEMAETNRKDTENYSFWSRGFSELRRISIEAFLPEFQTYTNHLLNLIESGLSLQLSTIRSRKKGGDPIESFTINVCSPEGKIRSFNTFSQGEKRRVASCMALALKHLSQNKGYQPFEFSLFDEVVDGLDSTGVEEFFKLLDSVPGLDLVISHSSELNSRFNNRLHIVRRADKTEIIQ
jgi:DNA repair exonuclease SbcCD ATPase subunit